MTQQARPSVITKLRQLHDLHAGRACLASHPGVSPTMSAQVMALPADNAMALLTGYLVRHLGLISWGRLPFLLSSPVGGGRPYACRGQMPSRVLRRLAIFRCIPVRLGSRPVSFMDVDQSAVAVAGP